MSSQRKPPQPRAQPQQSHWDYFCIKSRCGRKCECPRGRRTLQKSDNLQKQMCSCTLCVWKCLPAGQGCPQSPGLLRGACPPLPGPSFTCPTALSPHPHRRQPACCSCPLPASSGAGWPLCASRGKYLLRAPANNSGQMQKEPCSLSRVDGYFGNWYLIWGKKIDFVLSGVMLDCLRTTDRDVK